jgi:hypothetical protein
MKNPPYNLIVFAGRLQHGKTASAKILEKKGYTRMRFAQPMKDMLMALGLTQQQVEVDKSQPCELIGWRTPRHALQTLGTQWGRDMMHENIWVGITEARIKAELAKGNRVVIDDCRFDNEAEMLSRLGAIIVRVKRDALEPKRSTTDKLLFALGIKREHASEAGISDRFVDITIKNNGTLEDLTARVEAVADGSYFVSAQVYDAVLDLQTKPA